MLRATESSVRLDALMPPEVAARAESMGEQKARLDAVSTATLAVLAGAFIAWGAAFATVATTGGEALPFGVTRVLGGIVFCLGLILVVVAGAELFTGNNLIVMAWASGRISSTEVLRNWGIVYLGNLAGALGTVLLVFFSGQPDMAEGAVGEHMMRIAESKCILAWQQALVAGIGCNTLVCLAVWLCMSGRTVTDKVLAILFPITAFVATGMEHCVANMYLVPIGMLTKVLTQPSGAYPGLTLGNFLLRNLIPVTIGNIIGGALLVGMVYWFAYLRSSRKAESSLHA